MKDSSASRTHPLKSVVRTCTLNILLTSTIECHRPAVIILAFQPTMASLALVGVLIRLLCLSICHKSIGVVERCDERHVWSFTFHILPSFGIAAATTGLLSFCPRSGGMCTIPTGKRLPYTVSLNTHPLSFVKSKGFMEDGRPDKRS